MSKEAGVVVDNYKLKTFRKNLKAAGFEWVEVPMTTKTTIMKVAYTAVDIDVLAGVVKTSNDQSSRN